MKKTKTFEGQVFGGSMIMFGIPATIGCGMLGLGLGLVFFGFVKGLGFGLLGALGGCICSAIFSFNLARS